MKPSLQSVCRLVFTLVVLLPASALADTSQYTLDFVKNAMLQNQFLIDTSQYAVSNSQTRRITDYANIIITDHTKSLEDLKAILASNSIDSAMPAETDPARTEKMQSLTGTNADTVDKAYIEIQSEAQDDINNLYSEYFRKGDNQEIKDYVSLILPKLADNLKAAKTLQSSQ